MKLFCFIVSITLLTSCYYNSEEIILDRSISYNKHAKKIIDDKCNNCHSPNASQLVHPPFLTTYNEVVSQGQRIQVRVLNQGNMPPSNSTNGFLTKGQKDTLQTWIKNGFPE